MYEQCYTSSGPGSNQSAKSDHIFSFYDSPYDKHQVISQPYVGGLYLIGPGSDNPVSDIVSNDPGIMVRWHPINQVTEPERPIYFIPSYDHHMLLGTNLNQESPWVSSNKETRLDNEVTYLPSPHQLVASFISHLCFSIPFYEVRYDAEGVVSYTCLLV